MLMLLSPAKTLDYESPLMTQEYTRPELLDKSQELIEVCRTLSAQDVAKLMKISDKLAALNMARFGQWHKDYSLGEGRQAIQAFKGDVYTGLDAQSLTTLDLDFAQRHLRILSGLYGLLRPLDIMLPYRLEMGCKLENPAGKDLYQFWGSQLTEKLNEVFAELGAPLLVNLASNEYFKAVKPKLLDGRVVSPVFKDCKNGQYKIISFYAKKARGLMARYIIENRITRVEEIQNFDVAGYYYAPEESTADQPVFKREELR
ncbi:peroxide stress protein YaaA [Dongshaea marina]|uniref:peroxide stress protein YaaA n=1 Tax=Dongshaea marina TaxID=2047966 RepID=UPI000D3E80B5|nr:peroxide stress protein YaaA [Dongshaea marina]